MNGPKKQRHLLVDADKHRLLKIRASTLGISVKELVDSIVDQYLEKIFDAAQAQKSPE